MKQWNIARNSKTLIFHPTSVIGFIGVRVYPNTPIAGSWLAECGIEPEFYIAPEVQTTIVDFLKETAGRVVGGLCRDDKGINAAFERMRKRELRTLLGTNGLAIQIIG